MVDLLNIVVLIQRIENCIAEYFLDMATLLHHSDDIISSAIRNDSLDATLFGWNCSSPEA